MAPLFDRVACYTRFVRLSKHALLVLAVVLSALICVVVWVNTTDDTSRIVFSGQPEKAKLAATAEPSVMEKPHYQGFDSRNRPFTITADQAIQKDAHTVLLERMSSDLTLEAGKWTSLKANHGIYHTNAKILEMQGDIHLFYEGGYEFRTEAATVDVHAGTAHGEQPVTGQGPAGTLQASRFTILERGAIVHFEGAVKVVLYL